MIQQPQRFMDAGAIARAQQEYLTKVYTWMVGGLLVTALTAFYTFSNDWDLAIIGSGMIWILFLGQLGLVIALSGWINRMSKMTAGLSFLVYAFLNGLTFSVIFRSFTAESLYNTFFVAAGMFAALSFYGYVTKKNLSGVGNFMFMGLVGIILASIFNIFFYSSVLNFVVTIIGVVVFAGLTAYDTQKIKENYLVQFDGDEVAARGAIFGALQLYLDFINLFLFLLRLVGNRN
jgi:uncharacterized protein